MNPGDGECGAADSGATVGAGEASTVPGESVLGDGCASGAELVVTGVGLVIGVDGDEGAGEPTDMPVVLSLSCKIVGTCSAGSAGAGAG